MVCGYLVKRFFPDKREGEARVIRAMEMLASATSDVDLVLDWLLYSSVVEEDIASKPLQNLLLAVCIFGTICWLFLTSDSRFVSLIIIIIIINVLSAS